MGGGRGSPPRSLYPRTLKSDAQTGARLALTGQFYLGRALARPPSYRLSTQGARGRRRAHSWARLGAWRGLRILHQIPGRKSASAMHRSAPGGKASIFSSSAACSWQPADTGRRTHCCLPHQDDIQCRARLAGVRVIGGVHVEPVVVSAGRHVDCQRPRPGQGTIAYRTGAAHRTRRRSSATNLTMGSRVGVPAVSSGGSTSSCTSRWVCNAAQKIDRYAADSRPPSPRAGRPLRPVKADTVNGCSFFPKFRQRLCLCGPPPHP